MPELTIGKTRIELSEHAASRESLARLVGPAGAESVVLARIGNGFCQAKVVFNNRPKTESYYLNGSLALDGSKSFAEARVAVEQDFYALQEVIYRQAQETLEKHGQACALEESGLQLCSGAQLLGAGSLHYYIPNEYRWPSTLQEEGGVELLCAEVALCAFITGVLYDMVNRVVVGDDTHVAEVLSDTLGAYLEPDVTAARASFKDDVLSAELSAQIRQAVNLLQDADAELLGKIEALQQQRVRR